MRRRAFLRKAAAFMLTACLGMAGFPAFAATDSEEVFVGQQMEEEAESSTKETEPAEEAGESKGENAESGENTEESGESTETEESAETEESTENGGITDTGENAEVRENTENDEPLESADSGESAEAEENIESTEDKEIAEAEETPAGEESTETEETSAGEESTETEGTPAGEESAETEETPAGEESTETEETPTGEESTETEETPAGEESTETEEIPAGEESTETEEISAGEESTETEETPAGEENTEAEDPQVSEESSEDGEMIETGESMEVGESTENGEPTGNEKSGADEESVENGEEKNSCSLKLIVLSGADFQGLEGAVFTIEQQMTDGATGENWWQYLAGDGSIFTDQGGSDIGAYTTDGDGMISVENLESGTYRVTQVRTREGLSLMTEAITVTLPLACVAEENDGGESGFQETNTAVTAQSEDDLNQEDRIYYYNYEVTCTIFNTANLRLPYTGGNPRMAWLAGLVGMLAAGLVLFLAVDDNNGYVL